MNDGPRRPGVSNSRAAKALFAARDTLSEIQKNWDNNKSF